MTDERGPTALLEERPELESALETVLTVDETHDDWTFDDIDIDSGTFGELVSHGVVESDGEAYTVTDPSAVRRALNGDTAETDDSERNLPLPEIEPRAVGFLTLAVAAVVLARTYVLPTVYRGGDIVLSGNDAYAYRYRIERLLAEGGTGVDLGALQDGLIEGEPLMVTTLGWTAELLGGTARSVGHVLAWYPVVSAVISAILVYLLAVRVTDDRRVGLASVLFLALIPSHAFRTSLGFADHHAFDYPWLALTALGLVVVVTSSRDRGTLRTAEPWLGGLLLSVGITGQVLAWEAGPLLIVPVGVALAGKTLLDVEADRSPFSANAPVLAGTGLAALLVWAAHVSWGWHTELVASTPVVLFAGAFGIVATASVTRYLGGDVWHLVGVDAVGLTLAVIVGREVFTAQWTDAVTRTGSLFRSDAIAETYGLFDPGTMGFLLLFGFALVLALPVMVWSVRRAADGRAGWLVVSVYGWSFLILATLQVRFAGELATFASLFAGYAFVWLAARVEVARPLVRDESRLSATLPERRTLASLGLLFLLFGSLGLVQVPVKTSQVTVDDGVYRTAIAIESDADEQGLAYPENYVLSRWSDNRVYNYFVNGESRSYSYARGLYVNFSRSTAGEQWYNRLSSRVGYVVSQNLSAGPRTVQSRLHDHYGSRSPDSAGLGHYQAVYATESGSHKAFQLVPGAVIEGRTDANTTVTVTTTVTIPNAEFEYTRSTAVRDDGTYSIRVANSGGYTVETGNGTRTVRVTETAVRNGATVTVDESA